MILMESQQKNIRMREIYKKENWFKKLLDGASQLS